MDGSPRLRIHGTVKRNGQVSRSGAQHRGPVSKLDQACFLGHVTVSLLTFPIRAMDGPSSPTENEKSFTEGQLLHDRQTAESLIDVSSLQLIFLLTFLVVKKTNNFGLYYHTF